MVYRAFKRDTAKPDELLTPLEQRRKAYVKLSKNTADREKEVCIALSRMRAAPLRLCAGLVSGLFAGDPATC